MDDVLARADGNAVGENERCAQVIGQGRRGVLDNDVRASRQARFIGADAEWGTGRAVAPHDDGKVVVFNPIILVYDFLDDGSDVGRLAPAGAAGR